MRIQRSLTRTERVLRRALRWAAALVLACVSFFAFAGSAHAYTWMIRHGYTGCTPCHADPSGGGALTPYGRAQGDLLLRTRYGGSSEEASPTAGFLWGAVPLPADVRLGGDFRGAFLDAKREGAPADSRTILMRSDLFGDVSLGRLRLAGSIGYVPLGALGSALTRSPTDNLVSRDHWVGLELDSEATWLVRAGRIARPFGIRNIEHTMWVRSMTRSDLNDTQQHGLALALNRDGIRAEIMAILGNYQLRPDDYRERGYSGYVEWAPSTNLALGVSSQLTRARRDIAYRVTTYRNVHGAFVRYAPIPSLVLLSEVDWIYQSLTWNGHRGGYAALAQGDWEPTQGVHFLLTGEARNGGSAGEPPSFSAWASAVWFFAPHADVRLDDTYQRIGGAAGDTDVLSLLLQLHVYL